MKMMGEFFLEQLIFRQRKGRAIVAKTAEQRRFKNGWVHSKMSV
jgi:hypothetical protein